MEEEIASYQGDGGGRGGCSGRRRSRHCERASKEQAREENQRLDSRGIMGQLKRTNGPRYK